MYKRDKGQEFRNIFAHRHTKLKYWSNSIKELQMITVWFIDCEFEFKTEIVYKVQQI